MKKVFVAGHKGMVGSAICRRLEKKSDIEVITRERRQLDLCNQAEVHEFVKSENPDEVIIAAARVGGIHANNTFPAEFIYQNLQIQNNIIHAAHTNNVQKLLFLGSSCIYPRAVEQPMKETALLTGVLEPTNEPYAIAKIAGIKMCESYNRQYGRDYRSLMPTNLYGPGDNYHAQNSHVIPALIRKFHEAKSNNLREVQIWGTGKVRREFLHVDDLANASLFILDLPSDLYNQNVKPMTSHINVGAGEDITILDLAQIIASICEYEGNIITDPTKPDGPVRKLMDSSLIQKLGWRPVIELHTGLLMAYKDFKLNSRGINI